MAAAAASPGCDGAPAKGGERTVSVAGMERRVVVRVPADYDGKTPRPLVVAFHGFTQSLENAEMMFAVGRAWPEAVVAYPRGTTRRYPGFPGERLDEFRDGVGVGWQVSRGELGDRDLAFFDALREAVGRAYCVDRSRLYVLGFSNGAYFASLLGCERPEAVGAIVAAGGGIRCEARKPVPVMLFHGAQDRIVRVQESVDATRVWAATNGCRPGADSTALGCVARQGCSAEVVLCVDEGEHHYEPSFTDEAVEFFRKQRAR